jgi:hypothetical protein
MLKLIIVNRGSAGPAAEELTTAGGRVEEEAGRLLPLEELF